MKAKLSVGFKEKDFGLKRLKKELEALKNKPCVKVGIQGKTGLAPHGGSSKENLTVADVAAINEFGAPSRKIPARPLFRNTAKQHAEDWKKTAAELLKQILDARTGMTTRKALGLLGERVKGDFQRYFTDPGFKGTIPNKPSTIKQKGSSQPLIDTGRLRQSITYAVEMKPGEKAKEEGAETSTSGGITVTRKRK